MHHCSLRKSPHEQPNLEKKKKTVQIYHCSNRTTKISRNKHHRATKTSTLATRMQIWIIINQIIPNPPTMQINLQMKP